MTLVCSFVGVRAAAGAAMSDAIADNLKPGLEFKVMSPGNFDEDRELVRYAKVLIGVHGGGLPVNMMFMKPDSHVIEIVDQMSSRMLPYCCLPYHTFSSNAMNINHWLSPPLQWAEWEDDVRVDIVNVLSILRHIGVLKDDAVVPASVRSWQPDAPDVIPPFKSVLTPGEGNTVFGPDTCAAIPMNAPPGPGPAKPFTLPTLQQLDG